MKLGAILLLALIASASHGDSGNELYNEDYEKFWRQWQKAKASAMECSDPEKMAEFISRAIEISVNSEVTQANSKVLEGKLLSNPSCVLDGFSRLPNKEMSQAIEVFLVNPVFTTAEKIEEILCRAWDVGDYTNIKYAYDRLSGKC